MSWSRRGNGDAGELTTLEAITELSSKLLLIVSLVESTNKELMHCIRRENEQTREVIKTLIEETKKSTEITKSLLQSQNERTVQVMKECCSEIKTCLEETVRNSLNTQNSKEETKRAKEKIENVWTDKLQKREGLFWRFHRNKRLNEVYQQEIEKENPMMPNKFQNKPRDKEPEEEYLIRKEFAKESLKTELKLLKVRYMRQQKYISDIDVEMISSIQKQFNEIVSENLIQQ